MAFLHPARTTPGLAEHSSHLLVSIIAFNKVKDTIPQNKRPVKPFAPNIGHTGAKGWPNAVAAPNH